MPGMDWFSRFVATVGFSGYSPVAPGTVGSLIAAVAFRYLFPKDPRFLAAVVACAFGLGCWASTRVERSKGKDPSVVNIDEAEGMWLSVAFFPQAAAWPWLAVAFLVFRLFDILKPFPANVSQRLPGGFGIMADDLVAGLYTNLVLRMAAWAVGKLA